MKRKPQYALLAVIFVLLTATLSRGQSTAVTLIAQDADSQTWNLGSWSATLYSPPGVSTGSYVVAGTNITVPNQAQIGLLSGTGQATLTVTPNASIYPSGTQWMFNFCPAAAPGPCAQFPITINGTTQTVAPALQPIRLSVSNPIVRVTAYLDLEVTGAAVGSFYFNLNDSTMHVCTAVTANNCLTWVIVGTGGGGGGGITGLTTGLIPQAGSPTSIINTNPQLDNGVTLANALSYLGSAGLNLPSDGVHAGSVQIVGNTTLPAFFASNFVGFIGPNSASFTSYFLQFSATAPTVNGQAFTCNIPSSNVSQCSFTTPSTGLPVSPQIGDAVRYNVNADSAWDAVNYAQPIELIYAVNQASALQVVGPYGTSTTAPTGSQTTINPTATLQSASKLSAVATPSLNTVIGMSFGSNGNVSLMGMLAFYRWTFKFAIGNTSSVRYWLGLGCLNSTGAGNNSQAIVGTTAYAADTPNKTTLGFRFSATTDTHWQAVSAIAGGSQTTTDTGVTPDTNPHVFEMTTNAAGTSVFFWIDGSLVATISSNLPNPASVGDSWGSRFFTGDNKNSSTAISATFYTMQTAFKW